MHTATPHAILEEDVLAQADAVANCAGTRKRRAAHPDALPAKQRVIHNATAASRRRGRIPDRSGRPLRQLASGFKGSPPSSGRPRLPLPLHIVGGRASELGATVPAGVEVSAPLPFQVLHVAHDAVLLADNRFGRHLTNPLKLWDYLATAQPIVAPDLRPSTRSWQPQA